ncbi:hypothetical protein ACE6H2_006906 [Prunus campanulata]
MSCFFGARYLFQFGAVLQSQAPLFVYIHKEYPIKKSKYSHNLLINHSPS